MAALASTHASVSTSPNNTEFAAERRSEDPDGLLAAGEECPAAASSAVRARPGRRE